MTNKTDEIQSWARLLSENPYLQGLQKVVNKTVSVNVSEKKYKAAKLFHANKDLSKAWYVYFYVRHPEWTPTCRIDINGNKIEKFQRFRVKAQINRIHSVKGRLRAGRILKNAVNDLLQSGWSPFIVSDLSGTKWERTDTALREVIRLKKNTVERRTHQAHISVIGRFIDWLRLHSLAHLPPDLIERKNILDYLNALVEQDKISNNTRNNHLNHIRSMFSYLFTQEVIDRNPATGIKKAPVIYGEKNVPMTDDEIEKVIAFLSNRHTQLLLFAKIMYGCGLRGKEICRLYVNDIDLDRGEILVKGAVSKADKRDHVVIPEYLIDEIAVHIENRPNNYPLFSAKWEVSKSPLERNRVSELWKKLIKEELGVKKDMYSLRHKSSIDMHDSGFEMIEIRDRLRHASVTQTEQYMRSIVARNKEKLRKQMPKLGSKNK